MFDDEFLHIANRRIFHGFIAMVGVNIFLIGALIVVATRSKAPPYVIAVDHGEILGYAQPFAGNSDLGPLVIEDAVKRFIYNSRVVSTNSDLETRNIHVAYSMVRGQAVKALDAYYTETPDDDPIKLGQKGDWRDVHITRCLKQPEPDTYRVEWTETLYHPGADAKPASSNWAATIKITVGPPDRTNDLNPIGLYITNMDMEAAR